MASSKASVVRSVAEYGVGDYVLIRCEAAGVHVGHLAMRTGREVLLRDARRLWSWDGANTLNEISLRGVNVAGSKVSESVPTILLIDVIEVLMCSDAARRNLESAKWQ